MQIIGLATVVLFLASLASFLSGFLYPDLAKTGGVLGALFLGIAAITLAITIMKRNKTERI
jgi:multisubunit Na+/H+ antiporter MnhB subunit